MMKKSFLNRTNEFPALYMDMVFVESIRPILFTCVDEDGRLYICSCCYASGDKCTWIIADTAPDDVISLLRNECEIRDMFGNNGRVTVVTKYAGTERPEIRSFALQDVPEELLPTKGYGMDAEEGEFEEELKELQSRLDHAEEYEMSFAQDSFYAIVRTLHAIIRPNISTEVPRGKYWENNRRTAFVMGGVKHELFSLDQHCCGEI